MCIRDRAEALSYTSERWPDAMGSSRTVIYSVESLSGSRQGSRLISIVDGDVIIAHQGRHRKVGAITIDEFQDCPEWFVRFVNDAVHETSCRFITVALDAHQTIFGASNSRGVNDFVRDSRSIFLGYSYRMTRELLEHSFSVLSRYAPEYMDSLDIDQGIRVPLTTLSGPRVRYVCTPNSTTMLEEARKVITELEQRYQDVNSLAVIYLQYWSVHFHKRNRIDPMVEALKVDPVLGKYYRFGFWTKGKEYFAGVVLCPESFFKLGLGQDTLLRLNTMFVALTRFRQELTVIYHPAAPAIKYLVTG